VMLACLAGLVRCGFSMVVLIAYVQHDAIGCDTNGMAYMSRWE